MEKITSRQNTKVKYLAGLHTRKKRKETGEIILEGPNLVREALVSGVDLLEIFVTEEYYQKNNFAAGANVVLVSNEVMDKIAPSRTPQGIVARIKRPDISWREILKENRLLILEGLQDPGNVGTLIRTAAGAGSGGVILLGEGADPYQPKVLRATAGSIFKIPVAEIPKEEKNSFLDELGNHFSLFQARPGEGEDFREIRFPEKSALILGHETRGISPELANISLKTVTIPLEKGIESLNVAAAGAVLLFAMQFQRSS